MVSTQQLVANASAALLSLYLAGCGGAGPTPPDSTTAPAPPPGPTTTTTTTTTTTVKPLVAWSAKCADHDKCSGQGDCCPSAEGKFGACCGKVDSNVTLDKFVGVGYTTVPSKIQNKPVCDDFMSEWSEPLWGTSARDDLRVIKDLGATAVRTYGIGSHIDHAEFLNHAEEVGLKVLPGFADYPYLHLGSSCNIENVEHLPTDCIRKNDHDCHDVMKAHYTEMLKNGYTVVGTDGVRRYHPSLHTITVINECELKLFFNNAEAPLGVHSNHARVIASAADGILSAEDELDIQGPRPPLTATVSYGKCDPCKSVLNNFPGAAGVPGMPWLADIFLAFQNPQDFISYTPKHDLMQVYQTRWVNSFNTPRPAETLCQTEDMLLKKYMASPFSNIPIYIGEFHSHIETPQQLEKDIVEVRALSNNSGSANDKCSSDGSPTNLAGFNIFEFQISYWKGSGAEGATATTYGLWALGDESIAKTHADKDSIGDKEWDVWCLKPAKERGQPANPGEANLVQATINALGGQWPTTAGAICNGYAPSTTATTSSEPASVVV